MLIPDQFELATDIALVPFEWCFRTFAELLDFAGATGTIVTFVLMNILVRRLFNKWQISSGSSDKVQGKRVNREYKKRG